MTILVLRIGCNTIAASLVRRGVVLWAGQAAHERPDDLGEAIARIAAEESLPVRTRRLRVVLEPPLVQVRELRGLPPVRRSALRSLVALQAGRFFRRNGKPLVTDATWERRTTGKPRVAWAAAVEEPWLDAITSGARAAGLQVEAITPADECGGAVLELVSSDEQARRRGIDRLTVRRLAIGAASAWVAAVAIVTIRLTREERRIERELAALDAPAKAVMLARRRLGETARTVEPIGRAELERQTVLAHVAAIVGVLPDSSYLTSLAVDALGGGSLTGAAKQAPLVAAALERAQVVVGPRLVGPTVREIVAGREWERFTLSFGRGGKR